MGNNSCRALDLSTRRIDTKFLKCENCGKMVTSSSIYDSKFDPNFKPRMCKSCQPNIAIKDDLEIQSGDDLRDKRCASPENEEKVVSKNLNNANQSADFSNSESLKEDVKKTTHLRKRHDKYPGCKKPFTNLKDLDSQRKHNKEKKFKCSECENCFTRKDCLTKHLMTHSGERPFRCPECETCFARKDHLIIHQRFHSGEKPFKCRDCDTCFARKDYLTTHQRIHSGKKPFRCPKCEKCVAQKGSLNRHQKIHSG